MRPLAVCSVLLVPALFLAAETPKEKWQKVAPKGSGAEVLFPGKVAEQAIKGGQQYSVLLPGKGTYAMNYADLGAEVGFLGGEAAKKILGAIAENAGKTNKLLAQRDLRLGKFPGRFVETEAPDGTITRLHVYLTSRRVHTILVAGTKAFVDGDDAKKFLASFKLTEPPAVAVAEKRVLSGSRAQATFPGSPKEKVTRSGRDLSFGTASSYFSLSYDLHDKEIDVADAAVVKVLGDAFRVGLVKGAKGKLLANKAIKIGKYPGWDVEIEAPGASIYRVRICLTPRRRYTVMVFGPREVVDSTGKKFFDSFQLLDEAAWQRAALASGGASALFPARPDGKTTKKGAELEFMLSSSIGYALEYEKLPRALDVGDAAAVKKAFDDDLAEFLKGAKGKAIENKSVKLGKFPGRVVLLEAPGLGTMRGHVRLTPNGFYRIMVIGPRAVVDGADAKKFLESFRPEENQPLKKER